MNTNSFNVSLSKNPDINMNVVPGHFTTSHFHLSHFLNLDDLKTSSTNARDVAIELATPYISSTPIDTIVCMEETELIGAYLADELTYEGTSVINSGKDIYVIKPTSNTNRQLFFKNNLQQFITGHNVLLLVSSISSGLTLNTALEMLAYYGANLVGVSALFTYLPKSIDMNINYLFTGDDIPGYKMYKPSDCELCKNGQDLDAIIIQGGYTEI